MSPPILTATVQSGERERALAIAESNAELRLNFLTRSFGLSSSSRVERRSHTCETPTFDLYSQD